MTIARSPCGIRCMIRRDMPEVLAIERGQFALPWSEGDFIECLRKRNCIGMVTEDKDEAIAGYMLYELHKERLGLVRIAVRERLEGVGTRLIEKAKSKLSLSRRSSITTHVPEYALGAQLFFRSMGFVATGGDGESYDFIYRVEWGAC